MRLIAAREMLNKLRYLPGYTQPVLWVDLIPGLLTLVPEQIGLFFLKGLTNKHKGLTAIINVTSAELWCKEPGGLGEKYAFEMLHFPPPDFTPRTRIWCRLLLCTEILGKHFLFSLEALVSASSEHCSNYIWNVYIFLKSLGNVYNWKLLLEQELSFVSFPSRLSSHLLFAGQLWLLTAR